MSQQSISLLTLTVAATAALAADRFVTVAGGYPTAGGVPLGVTRSSSGAAGDLLPVDVMGTAIVEAGAAIALGDTLMVGTDGKAITHDGDGDKHAVGRALQVAAGDGSLIEVLLIPSAGLLVTAV